MTTQIIDNSMISVIPNPFGKTLTNPTITYTDGGIEYKDIPLKFDLARDMIIIPAGIFSSKNDLTVKLKNGLDVVDVLFQITDIDPNKVKTSNCSNTCNTCNRCSDSCSCNLNVKDYDYEFAVINSLINQLDCNYKDLLSRLQSDEALLNDLPQLKNLVNVIQTDFTALNTKVAILETTSHQHDIDIATLKTQVSDLDSRILKNTGDIASQLTKITKLESDLTKLSGEVKTNENNITSLETRYNNEVSALQGQVATLNNELSATNSLLNTVKSNLQTEINRGDVQDADIVELKKLKPRVEKNENDIATLNSKISGNTSKIASNKTEIDAIDVRVAKNSTDIATINADLLAKEQQILNNAKDIAVNIKDIQQLKNTDSHHDTLIADLNTKLTAGLNDINTLKSQVLAIETWQTAINGDLASLHSKLSNLETIYNSLQATVVAMNSKIVDIECRIDILEDEYSKLAQLVFKLENSFENLKKELADYEARLCAIEKITSQMSLNNSAVSGFFSKMSSYNDTQKNKVFAHLDSIANS